MGGGRISIHITTYSPHTHSLVLRQPSLGCQSRGEVTGSSTAGQCGGGHFVREEEEVKTKETAATVQSTSHVALQLQY